MDKNIIKKHLIENFLSEDKKPDTLSTTEKIQSDSKKINRNNQKEVAEKMKRYEKPIKAETEPVKRKLSDKEKGVHSDEELFPGSMAALDYDSPIDKKFADRFEKSLAGHETTGNSNKYANVVQDKVWGGDPNFGKTLVDQTKKMADEKNAVWAGMGDTMLPYGVRNGNYALSKNKKINEGLTEKGLLTLGNWVKQLGADEAAVKLIDKVSETGIVSSFPDSIEYGEGLNIVSKHLANGKYDAAYKKAKTLANKLEKKGMRGMFENVNENKKIKEGMKRLVFKKEFKGVENALRLIPESYKVNNKQFQMTDGNEKYEIRWEGNLTEGRAVILKASDKQLMNEDMQKMKHLMGYKSQETLGNLKGAERINEDKTFNKIWNKTKNLLSEQWNPDESYTGPFYTAYYGDEPGQDSLHVISQDEVNEYQDAGWDINGPMSEDEANEKLNDYNQGKGLNKYLDTVDDYEAERAEQNWMRDGDDNMNTPSHINAINRYHDNKSDKVNSLRGRLKNTKDW